MSSDVCILHQIRITALEREVENVRKHADIAWTLMLEAENVRLRRIEEAAECFNEHPSEFTHEILQAALACK